MGNQGGNAGNEGENAGNVGNARNQGRNFFLSTRWMSSPSRK